MVRANAAAVQVVCGAMLAMGRAPAGLPGPRRLAVAHHPGRALVLDDRGPGDPQISGNQSHKNLAMIGGLIFAALDEPQPRPE